MRLYFKVNEQTLSLNELEKIVDQFPPSRLTVLKFVRDNQGHFTRTEHHFWDKWSLLDFIAYEELLDMFSEKTNPAQVTVQVSDNQW